MICMNDDTKYDNLLYKACRENKDELAQLGPDFSKIEKGALLSYRQRSRKHKSKIVFRTLAAVFSAVVLLNIFLFFTDIAPVKAYRDEIRKLVFNLFSSKTDSDIETQYYIASTEIQKIQKQVPFTIPVPGWVPPGYTFKSAEMRNDEQDIYTVTITYVNGNDTLLLNVTNNTSISETVPSPDEPQYDEMNINGNKVYIRSYIIDNIALSKCYFYNSQGLLIDIYAPIDKQSLIMIIESLK